MTVWINKETPLEVVELILEEEPKASSVLLGNVVWRVSSVIFQLLIPSSSKRLIVVPPFPSVVAFESEVDPFKVDTSVWMAVS